MTRTLRYKVDESVSYSTASYGVVLAASRLEATFTEDDFFPQVEEYLERVDGEIFWTFEFPMDVSDSMETVNQIMSRFPVTAL